MSNLLVIKGDEPWISLSNDREKFQLESGIVEQNQTQFIHTASFYMWDKFLTSSIARNACFSYENTGPQIQVTRQHPLLLINAQQQEQTYKEILIWGTGISEDSNASVLKTMPHFFKSNWRLAKLILLAPLSSGYHNFFTLLFQIAYVLIGLLPKASILLLQNTLLFIAICFDSFTRQLGNLLFTTWQYILQANNNITDIFNITPQMKLWELFYKSLLVTLLSIIVDIPSFVLISCIFSLWLLNYSIKITAYKFLGLLLNLTHLLESTLALFIAATRFDKAGIKHSLKHMWHHLKAMLLDAMMLTVILSTGGITSPVVSGFYGIFSANSQLLFLSIIKAAGFLFSWSWISQQATTFMPHDKSPLEMMAAQANIQESPISRPPSIAHSPSPELVRDEEKDTHIETYSKKPKTQLDRFKLKYQSLHIGTSLKKSDSENTLNAHQRIDCADPQGYESDESVRSPSSANLIARTPSPKFFKPALKLKPLSVINLENVVEADESTVTPPTNTKSLSLPSILISSSSMLSSS